MSPLEPKGITPESGDPVGRAPPPVGLPAPEVCETLERPSEPSTSNGWRRLVELLKRIEPLAGWALGSGRSKAIVVIVALYVMFRVGPPLYAKFRETRLGAYLAQKLTHPISVRQKRSRLPPPYDPAVFLLSNLVDGFSGDQITVVLGDRILDSSKGDFSVSALSEDMVELSISFGQFEWADEPGQVVEVVIIYHQQELYRGEISVAPRPIPRLEETEDVGLLPALGEPEARTSEQALGEFLWESESFLGPAYLVGPGEAVVWLPEVIVQNSRLFVLTLGDEEIEITGNPALPVRIDTSRHQQASTCGKLVLGLSYMGRKLSEVALIRYVAPLLESNRGRRWTLPSGKARYWDYTPDETPGTIRASEQVPPGMPGRQGHNLIRFDHLAMLVQPGVYIIEADFEGVGGGSLSVTFTRCFEGLVPRGAGERQPAFKFAHELNWAEHERQAAYQYWRHKGVELVFGNPNTEAKFFVWPEGFGVADTQPHTVTLVVRVSRPQLALQPNLSFALYVDDAPPAIANRYAEWRRFEYIPEIRHRGCVNLVLWDFRVFHLREE